MLLDTSGLLCMHYSSEPFHTQAVSAYRSATTRWTHSYILAEYIALTNARRYSRSSALAFVVDLLDSPEVNTVWVDELLYRSAIELLKVRQDKGYSLCDAISFELMRRHRITNALTTDRHFKQEGFIRLLNI